MIRYHVFLSYIMEDADVMWRVYHDLQVEGLQVWIDQTNLEPGTLAWDRAIEDAIVNSGCLVVILSPSARTSEWVREELHYAKILNKRIFPLLASGEAHNAIPFGFSTAQYTDIRDESHYKDGIKKLIAAICKNLGLESSSARKERVTQERQRAEELERQRRAVDEARLNAETLQRQRIMLSDEIERMANEEKEHRLRADYLMLQRQKLQEEAKIIAKQQKQAHQHLLTMTANLKSMQEALGEADGNYQPDDRDWTAELQYLAEISYDDTNEVQAIWRDAKSTNTDLSETQPYDSSQLLFNGRRALPAPKKRDDDTRRR
jgi:hypothetical protein